jgi:type IV pilus assembly protein PilA
MIIKKLKNRGFTLVELMIVVAIVGVLAALAIYGVRKYINNAKTAEARNNIGRMAKDASAAWAKEGMAAAVLAGGETAGTSNRLCGTATPVPGEATSIQGQKYQSAPSEWGGDQDTGWTCLKFQVNEPQYYQYNYTAAGNSAFTAIAVGDLDGDTTTSEFSLGGAVDEGVVKLAPNIGETNPEE